MVIVVPEDLSKWWLNELGLIAVHRSVDMIVNVPIQIVVDVDNQSALADQLTVESEQPWSNDVWSNDIRLVDEVAAHSFDATVVNGQKSVHVWPYVPGTCHLPIGLGQGHLKYCQKL